MHFGANEGPLYGFRDILDRALDAPYQLSHFQNLKESKASLWFGRQKAGLSAKLIISRL
jgi:hypothetical protein